MKKVFPVIVCALALSACSKPSELHTSMEDMGQSFKSIKETDSAEQMKAELTKFSQALSVAKAQKIPADKQQTFDEGINKAETLVAEINTALDAGDMEKAQALFKDLGNTRKKYHDKLDVK